MRNALCGNVSCTPATCEPLEDRVLFSGTLVAADTTTTDSNVDVTTATDVKMNNNSWKPHGIGKFVGFP